MSQRRIVESEKNPSFKRFVAIKDGKGKKEGLLLVEGEDLIEEARRAGKLVEVISLEEDDRYRGVATTILKPSLYRALSSYRSLPKAMGIARFSFSNDPGERVVYLDGVQDPGNVGTIVRTALAFGYSSVVLSPDSASIYNAKTVQATKGALFRIQVCLMDLEALKDEGYHLYLTALDGEDESKVDALATPFALVLGNEGTGVRKEHLSYGRKLRIDMGGIDSLNVAVAGGIFLYRFAKR